LAAAGRALAAARRLTRVAMILFDAGIYQAGWQVTTRTLTMTDASR
jgi:hypothetical protein